MTSFRKSDYSVRAGRVRDGLAPRGIDALLLTSLTNIRWLSGFTGSSGWMLVTPQTMTLVTDGRYAEQAREQFTVTGAEVDVAIGATRVLMTDRLSNALSACHVERLGFEGAHISYADHRSLSATIGRTWIPTNGAVEELRRAKDVGELDRMESAAGIADGALAATLALLWSEPTEAEFRDALESAMRAGGADGPSFDTIVAAGANAAMPHHHPDATRIIEGMTVVIDFGALVDGYHSDMTRTFTIGDPTPLQAEVYQVVLQAQQDGVSAVAASAGGRAIDLICRKSIADAGWGDWFNHGTGHGVGLQIHESPWLTQSYDDTLAAMDVVTVEPGVYRKDFGGVRIEDMVVVTTNGCRPLTNTPKDSPCLPSRPTT